MFSLLLIAFQKRCWHFGVAAAMVAGGAELSFAAVLPPSGGSATPTGSFDLSGDTILAGYPQSVSYDNNDTDFGSRFKFTLVTSVYQDGTTGGLDFVYQLTNTAPDDSSADSFERFTVTRFGSFTTDVDYDASTGTSGTTTNFDFPIREVDRSTNGNVVGFDFSSVLGPDVTTDLMLVRTNASSVTAGSAQIQDGSNASVLTSVPFGATVAPEPASIGLLALGAVVALGRRRHKSPLPRSDAE